MMLLLAQLGFPTLPDEKGIETAASTRSQDRLALQYSRIAPQMLKIMLKISHRLLPMNDEVGINDAAPDPAGFQRCLMNRA